LEQTMGIGRIVSNVGNCLRNEQPVVIYQMPVLSEAETKLASWILMDFLMHIERASEEDILETCSACPCLSGCDISFPTCKLLFYRLLGIQVHNEVQ